MAFEWDGDWYMNRYPDVAKAVEQGTLRGPLLHYLRFGVKEGRFPTRHAENSALRSATAGPAPVPRIPVGNHLVPLDWPVLAEASKTFGLRLVGGFFAKYMSGAVILDVGYKGGHANAVPILPHAIGVDLDYPGYDGVRLPFGDETVHTVFSSHVLEHLADSIGSIRDWFRVLKRGGFIVCIVPHQFLYERKHSMPSRWSGEHLRFYSPATLLRDFEEALEPNSYRVRHLADNDLEYRYDLGYEHHPGGCYEIELVIEKIAPPDWKIA